MLRVAYVTPYDCGVGHAVRGAALSRAASKVGVDLRAFGPSVPLTLAGYEGSQGWESSVEAFAPQVLLGDLSWAQLERLRRVLAVPSWLLMRWVPPAYMSGYTNRWARVISTEPAADRLPSITHSVPPITVGTPRFEPTDGQELQAGYNAWWEAYRFGYQDRVRWQAATPEREARMAVGIPTGIQANGADRLMEEIQTNA